MVHFIYIMQCVRFSYDDLVYGVNHGLEIFPADGFAGLFLEWQSDEERFSENVVEIPKYTEARGNVMLTVVEINFFIVTTEA